MISALKLNFNLVACESKIKKQFNNYTLIFFNENVKILQNIVLTYNIPNLEYKIGFKLNNGSKSIVNYNKGKRFYSTPSTSVEVKGIKDSTSILNISSAAGYAQRRK